MELTKNRYDLTEGVIWKKLLNFFFPIAGGMLFQQLYNAVDAVVVGNFVGADALAAVGGSPAVILNLVIGFFMGLASGATVVISQYFGAGDREGITKAVHTAVAFCLALGAVLTVVGILITPWSLRLLHTPEDIMGYSTQYLRIFYVGTIPLMFFDMGSGILRAVGDSKRPLYYLIVCCLLNIGLDLLFVIVFKMEVAGAAWATVISVAISGILVMVQMCRARESYRLVPSQIRFHAAELRHMLHIGVPAGIQGAMYAVTNLLIQMSVNDLGTSTVAAWTLTSKLDGVYWAISNSFGVAITAFVGQNFGAKKYDRMNKSVKVCLGMAMGTAAVLSILLLWLGKFAFRLFVDDQIVINSAVEIMTFFVPYYFIWSFIEVISNSLRGAGDALWPMVITIVGICGLRIAWIIFVVPVWDNIKDISMCYPVTWAITAAVFVVYFLAGKWLPRCITRAEEGK